MGLGYSRFWYSYSINLPIFGREREKKSNFSKNILKMSTVMVVILCFSLWYADNNINIFMFLGIIVCANIFFEIGQTFFTIHS